MEKEKLGKFIELLTAYKDGETIQCRCIDPKEGKRYWEDIDDITEISLQDNIECYRVKPQYEYRPFETDEECWNEMQKHQPFGWITKVNRDGNLQHSFILSVSDGRVGNDCKSTTYDTAFQEFKFADGYAFGKLID